MSYRVMVRSVQGWRLDGWRWERKYVWSTMQSGLTWEGAMARKADYERGGVVAQVIAEASYMEFCASHTVC